MKTIALLSLLLTISFTVGCEVPEMEVVEKPAGQEVATAVEETVEEEVVDEIPDDQPPVTSQPREVTPNDPKKGKKSKAAGGYMGAVGNARFYGEHKLIFDSIKHALNLYWGTHGEYPKTHEEFMEKIIKFNNLALPELEEGVEYIYDPEDHKLKIYRPES